MGGPAWVGEGGREYSGPCPQCGGTDRFHVRSGPDGRALIGCPGCLDGQDEPTKRQRFGELLRAIFPEWERAARSPLQKLTTGLANRTSFACKICAFFPKYPEILRFAGILRPAGSQSSESGNTGRCRGPGMAQAEVGAQEADSSHRRSGRGAAAGAEPGAAASSWVLWQE